MPHRGWGRACLPNRSLRGHHLDAHLGRPDLDVGIEVAVGPQPARRRARGCPDHGRRGRVAPIARRISNRPPSKLEAMNISCSMRSRSARMSMIFVLVTV